MTTPRRRILRPAAVTTPADRRLEAARQRQIARLVKEQESLRRWMTRLKRACHALEKHQQCIRRLERSLAPQPAATG
jgi:hypothetical protein